MANWNEDLNDWVLKAPKKVMKDKGSKRPQSAVGLKRPTSEYSRIAKGLGDINPRFKFDNILDLDLDMPERSTEDYTGAPSVRVQSAINTILNPPEEDPSQFPLDTLVNFGDSNLQAKNQKKGSKRPKSGKKKKLQEMPDENEKPPAVVNTQPPPEEFPKARGMM